jgi:hypothetical protein
VADAANCSHYWIPVEKGAQGEPLFAGFPMPKMMARCVHCDDSQAFTYREWHDIPLALPPMGYKPA